MKNILCFLIFSFTCNSVFAQQFAVIRGHIYSVFDINIDIYKPVNGFFNNFFYKSESAPFINKTSNNILYFQDSILVNTSSLVRVYLTTKEGDFIAKSDLLVFPTDTVDIYFRAKDSTFGFSGNNAIGHKLFNDITKNPARISQSVDDIINEFPGNRNSILKDIEVYCDELCYPFEKLLNQKLITSEYYLKIVKNLHIWPVSMVAYTLMFRTKPGPIIPQQYIDSTIEAIYRFIPPDMIFHGFLNAEGYYKDYLSFQAYKQHHLPTPKSFYSSDTVIESITRAKIKVDKEFVRFLYIEDSDMRQNEWGAFLTSIFSFAPGEFDVSIINQYEELNPHNNWSKILRQQFCNYQYSANVLTPSISPIRVIGDSISVNTLGELVKLLPQSEFYYLDVWASWCGPCIKAFNSNAIVDSILQANHITKVYVSVDNNKEAWRKAMNKFYLGGYHVIANKSLIIDIIVKSGGDINSNFAIPKYLLINTEGEFVQEIYSPFTYEKLANQLKEMIGKTK